MAGRGESFSLNEVRSLSEGEAATDNCGGCTDTVLCESAAGDVKYAAAKCADDVKCDPADYKKCSESGAYNHGKAKIAAQKPAGCASGKKCGGH